MAGHLSIGDRDAIAQLRLEGFTVREIAARLDRSHTTVSRELCRNGSRDGYRAARAQAAAVQRRRDRPLVAMVDRPEVNEFIRRGLARYWSPEQIAGRLRREFPTDPTRHVSAQSIYTWIENQDAEDRAHWKNRLRRRGRRPRKRRENSGKAADRGTLADRPAIVEERGRLGDFEGDTVLGRPGTGGLITLVDRRSRFTIIEKIQRKDAPRVHRKIKARLQELAPGCCHTATFDNGTEFARCPRLEESLDMKIYFAKPGCPQQRGTNENTNGLIRQFFPKGSDFTTVSHQQARQAQDLLNSRPRACLDYRTPNEVFSDVPDAVWCN